MMNQDFSAGFAFYFLVFEKYGPITSFEIAHHSIMAWLCENAILSSLGRIVYQIITF